MCYVLTAWEYNSIHDNEGMALGMSLLFADDLTPSLTVHSNIIYENNCAQGNCAVFMMKNVNQTVRSNIVADSHYGSIFELAPYRMPAARMALSHNILCECDSTHHARSSHT